MSVKHGCMAEVVYYHMKVFMTSVLFQPSFYIEKTGESINGSGCKHQLTPLSLNLEKFSISCHGILPGCFPMANAQVFGSQNI